MNKFFNEYVGDNYAKGVNGKKVLVLGASFYCDKFECLNFKECTSVLNKDSSNFDSKCPVYAKDGKLLSNEPSYCIGDSPKTYRNFASSMAAYVGSDDYDTIWNSMAFTNYVQFFLPKNGGEFRSTMKSDLSERDYFAFLETLTKLQPDIVIVWGCTINSQLKEDNNCLVDSEELEETEGYVCHLKVPNVDHPIAIINPYHPSYSAWFANLDKFHKYLKLLLGI